MYFKQIDEIVNGTKTQTRRICKLGEKMTYSGPGYWRSDEPNPGFAPTVLTPGGRIKWMVERDYAVSPGRGLPCALWRPDDVLTPDRFYTFGRDGIWHPSQWTSYGEGVSEKDITRDVLVEFGFKPLRIRLLAIRREPLQDISGFDAIAEGVLDSVCWWCDGSQEEDGKDCHVCCSESALEEAVDAYRDLWNTINTRAGTRWEDRPDVWVLTFEVVRA